MELAINNVPKDLKNRLEKAWNFATAGNGNSAKKIYFNKPNERLKSEINKVFRKNIDIDNQIITLGHIRHINNRHGINGEIKSKVPMTKEIFAIIPYVLNKLTWF